MAKFSLALSDGLRDLSALFDDYTHEPRTLDPADARAFKECIKLLYRSARDLENELSRRHWNEIASDEQTTDAVLSEVYRPGSNVRLFPVIARPFHDGRPAGDRR